MDFFETINLMGQFESSINYGSCERGQDEPVSYCRHRNHFRQRPPELTGATFAIEWTPDFIAYYQCARPALQCTHRPHGGIRGV
jgi:hypothetical protein